MPKYAINPVTGTFDQVADALALPQTSQGHYALLSSAYYGGSGTTTEIVTEDTDVYQDLNFTVDGSGLYDHRIANMKSATAAGHTGAGTAVDPIVFDLEGLTVSSSCSFQAVFRFDPDEDGGRLDSRLCFTKNSVSGDSPPTEFFVEATSAAMESGADIDYAQSPVIKFIINEDITTHATGDAGSFRFQVRSDVAGTVTLDNLTLFIL